MRSLGLWRVWLCCTCALHPGRYHVDAMWCLMGPPRRYTVTATAVGASRSKTSQPGDFATPVDG